MTSRTRAAAAAMAALCLSFVPGAPSATDGTPGETVTQTVPFARETVGEARSLAPARIRRPSGTRVSPSHRIRGATDRLSPSLVPAPGGLSDSASWTTDGSPAAPAPAGAALFSAQPLAPEIGARFAGLAEPTTFSVVPPDTMGAAGPDHLVTLLNSEFAIFDKATGAIPPRAGSRLLLEEFWGSLGRGAGQPADFPFDPKVLYDPGSGRFIFSSAGGRAAPNAWILVAVSSTSNPFDAISKWAIDADHDADNVVRNNWADFPQLGVDERNVYVTANMYNNADNFQYAKVWVIPKAQLLAGNTTITWTEFRDPDPGMPTIQPAVALGPSPAGYFVYEDGSPGTLRLASITNTGPGGSPVWNPPFPIAVAPYVPQIALPGAPQLGTASIVDTTDTRLMNVVCRGGSLWTTHTVEAGGKTEVAWYKIDAATRTRTDQGRIGDPTRWYYMPSVAVNANGDMAIGFSGSSAGEYAGAYYTMRRASEPAGTTQAPALLKTGLAPYNPLPGYSPRWGDYSATVVDPTDNVAFWTLQEYAFTPRTDNTSRWGTWWGTFRPSALDAPTNVTATISPSTQVLLSWTNRSTGAAIRIERKDGPALDYAFLAQVDNAATSYADNSAAPGTHPYYRLLVFNAAGGAYSADAQAQIPAPPPASGGGGGGCAVLPGAGRCGDRRGAAAALPVLIAVLLLALRGRARPGSK